MTDRILIGDAVFRISKPGKSVTSTDKRDFVLREDMEVFKPYFTGSYAFSGAGSHSFSFAALSRNPVIVMRSSDNRPQGTCYYGYLNAARDTFTIVNRPDTGSTSGQARTITAFVFQTADAA